MLNLNFSVYRQKGKLIFFNCHFCIIMENDSTKSVMDRSFVIPNSESKVWVLVCGIFDNISLFICFIFVVLNCCLIGLIFLLMVGAEERCCGSSRKIGTWAQES